MADRSALAGTGRRRQGARGRRRARALAEALAFETRIDAALAVSVPANLAERILAAIPAEADARPTSSPRRWWPLALAATLAAAAVISNGVMHAPSGTTALITASVEHLSHEPYALTRVDPVPQRLINRMFTDAGLKLDSSGLALSYLNRCPLERRWSVHMVMPAAGGPGDGDVRDRRSQGRTHGRAPRDGGGAHPALRQRRTGADRRKQPRFRPHRERLAPGGGKGVALAGAGSSAGDAGIFRDVDRARARSCNSCVVTRRMCRSALARDALARNRHHPVLAGFLDVDELVIEIVLVFEGIAGFVDLTLAGLQRGLETLQRSLDIHAQGLRTPLHARLLAALRRDVAEHGGFQVGHFLAFLVECKAEEHVAGHQHQHWRDVDLAQHRGDQHAAVDAIGLGHRQRLVDEAHMLAHHVGVLIGGAGDARIADAARLQHMPDRVDLLQHRIRILVLVAGEAVDDATIQRLLENLVDRRMVLVDVSGEHPVEIQVRGVVVFVDVVQRVVDRAQAHALGALAERLAVHAELEFDIGRARLPDCRQRLVIPADGRRQADRSVDRRDHAAQAAVGRQARNAHDQFERRTGARTADIDIDQALLIAHHRLAVVLGVPGGRRRGNFQARKHLVVRIDVGLPLRIGQRRRRQRQHGAQRQRAAIDHARRLNRARECAAPDPDRCDPGP
ncbi:MAG: DUF3379 family protein [Rhodanobacteraceae bacterium]|nr:DUF3379 family protein [Rhodanobacteraceae bacterium]